MFDALGSGMGAAVVGYQYSNFTFLGDEGNYTRFLLLCSFYISE